MTRVSIYRLHVSGIGDLYKQLIVPTLSEEKIREQMRYEYPVRQGWLVLLEPLGDMELK